MPDLVGRALDFLCGGLVTAGLLVIGFVIFEVRDLRARRRREEPEERAPLHVQAPEYVPPPPSKLKPMARCEQLSRNVPRSFGWIVPGGEA